MLSKYMYYVFVNHVLIYNSHLSLWVVKIPWFFVFLVKFPDFPWCHPSFPDFPWFSLISLSGGNPEKYKNELCIDHPTNNYYFSNEKFNQLIIYQQI